ncbi:TetR/AcrR family transcriptional regulator [Arthrobacter mobilis]|uniref:TetR/AcrR family transcriptional regulator n=1 Tax=Arthrobacter mobilis TaxID=2724944 RepID=A0A7X6H9T1_9MICC|nr:TetR/AcrR family transcriptional regulator [Arthrobacter mobilis]NKX53104.1 TetR/AcrR family transcriptional regulator [Arthrobacter mobilis]
MPTPASPTTAPPGSGAALPEDHPRRRLILDAAERLLAAHGYDGIRLRDIAKEAGISIGLIQHYFETRDDVVHEMLVTACERRARDWQQLALRKQDPSAKVRALLEGAVTNHEHCTVWLESCAAASRHKEVQPVVASTNNTWRDALMAAITEGVAAGDFEPAAPVEQIVDIFVALIDGLILAVATRDPKITPDYTATLLLATARAQLRSDLGG